MINHEQHQIVLETLFKHNHPTHSTIAVLKWMNTLKTIVKVHNIVHLLHPQRSVALELALNFKSHFRRFRRL